MTASSDSSPASPVPPTAPSQADSSRIASPERTRGASLTARRPPRNWLSLLALALLAAGLGFVLWRVFAGRGGEQEMQMPPAPVEMERLQEVPLEDSSEFVGTLDSQAGVSLQPEADGRVTQIFVSAGDTVAAGDPIMQLSPERSQADYNAALASVSAARSARDSARAQLRAAEARQTELVADLQLQQTDYERTATLVAQGALPQENLDQISRDRTVAQSALNSARQEIAALSSSVEQAGATLNQTEANASATQQDLLDKTVTAPIAGIVGDIPIKLGDYVTAGSQLATITQNQDLELAVAVPIGEAPRLRTGMPVELIPFGEDEAIAAGNISFISPTTNTATQTVLAKARFSAPEQPLQDNQRLEVRIIWDQRPGVLVPATAISRLGGQTFVFVPGEPDPEAAGAPPAGEQPPVGQGKAPGEADGPPPMVARLKSVKLGGLQGNDYQVLEGLSAGDTVITSGLLNLRDGVPIMPASAAGESGQAAGETAGPPG
ncbi:MAG: efflux RND transporter periplasmic adaptor subunit [Phormidesmis sp.]